MDCVAEIMESQIIASAGHYYFCQAEERTMSHSSPATFGHVCNVVMHIHKRGMYHTQLHNFRVVL